MPCMALRALMRGPLNVALDSCQTAGAG